MSMKSRFMLTDTTSHVSFLMHLAHVITLTSWLKVCQVRIHSIHMSSRV